MKEVTMEQIFDAIRKLVSQMTGIPSEDLNRGTRIYEDLKVDGDDAVDLIQEFAKKFAVDMSTFDYDKHFAPEGFDLFGAVARLFKTKEERSMKSLTLGDLERAAKEGRWIPSVTPPQSHPQ